MCLGNDIPDAPPPPPPPPEDPIFQPGSEEDLDALDVEGNAANGKKALTTGRNSGLNIPTGV